MAQLLAGILCHQKLWASWMAKREAVADQGRLERYDTGGFGLSQWELESHWEVFEHRRQSDLTCIFKGSPDTACERLWQDCVRERAYKDVPREGWRWLRAVSSIMGVGRRPSQLKEWWRSRKWDRDCRRLGVRERRVAIYLSLYCLVCAC